EKEVPTKLEWNREIVSKRGGNVRFRIESQGPFSVMVVTGEGYKAVMSGNGSGFKKTDVLLNQISEESTFESTVLTPPGSSYFIIENRAGKPVKMHLQCYDASK